MLISPHQKLMTSGVSTALHKNRERDIVQLVVLVLPYGVIQ